MAIISFCPICKDIRNFEKINFNEKQCEACLYVLPLDFAEKDNNIYQKSVIDITESER
jgi:hypothetical protein